MIHSWQVVLSAALICAIAAPTDARAQSVAATSSPVPRSIPFNGQALRANGEARTGNVLLTFGLYAEQTGGTPIWTEQQLVTLDGEGRYAVVLGSASTAGVPAEAFAAATPKWLGVQVEGDAEQRRFMLLSVPYALKAGDADTVGGKPASDFVLSTNLFETVSSTLKQEGYAPRGPSATTSTANVVAKFIDGAGTIGDSNIVSSSSNVGINVAPVSPLHVFGASTYQTLRLDSAHIVGSSFTVNAGPTGGRAYSLLATGPGAVGGAGALSIYDENAGQFRMFINTSGNVGVGTSTPTAKLHVGGDGSFLATGQIGVGTIPAAGAGWRMMWYPYKVAFRAGYADAGGQFDDAKIGFYSWAGGALSSAPGNYAFAMGNQNLAEAQCAVALGSGNNVFGNATDGFGTCGIALGLNNDVKDQAGVTLGQGNVSDGDAAVAIGYTSTANADYSMAFGYRASTNGHAGAKVFGDASITDTITAVANNEFAVRAAGGYRLRTNATLTTGCNLPAGSGVFSCSSSKTLKDHFQAVDGEDVLTRLRKVPVTTWNYLSEQPNIRHMGPFAEDFRSAFGLGIDETSIGHIDLAGVTLAATQALEQRTTDLQNTTEQLVRKSAEVDRLRDESQQLRAEIAALRTANTTTEQRVLQLEHALRQLQSTAADARIRQ